MVPGPVCYMTVDENSAAATTVYKGETGCKEQFEKELEKYVEAPA